MKSSLVGSLIVGISGVQSHNTALFSFMGINGVYQSFEKVFCGVHWRACHIPVADLFPSVL
jgi:hypothetical protein